MYVFASKGTLSYVFKLESLVTSKHLIRSNVAFEE
jgi:hypothetical protein